jgi:hypothetical protein
MASALPPPIASIMNKAKPPSERLFNPSVAAGNDDTRFSMAAQPCPLIGEYDPVALQQKAKLLRYHFETDEIYIGMLYDSSICTGKTIV